MALPDEFVTHGGRAQLLEDCGLTQEHVVARVRAMTTGNRVG